MQPFHLASDFLDPELERGILVAIARTPALYWELLDSLPAGTFSVETDTWTALAGDVEAERAVSIPPDWVPVTDPQEGARRLFGLFQRRLWAESIERQVSTLYDDPDQPLDVLLEEEAARWRQAERVISTGRLQSGSDLAVTVLSQASERRRSREETGRSFTGVPTGLRKLDEILNGLGTALYVLAGPPGCGKTTLSLQMAVHAATSGTPVIYVTYENSSENLVQKLLCARAGIAPSDVDRGFADLPRLHEAACYLKDALDRLTFLEGTSNLSIAQVRGKALQVKARHKTDRVLVVFDYLQRAAHAKGYDQLRHNVSALAGELRDMANRLGGPVLAISSQNRSAGNYGNGGGTAALDSLKESGDLEYSADVVCFLRPSEKRQVTPPARALDLVVAKNRFGDLTGIPLVFRPDRGDLREEGREQCLVQPFTARVSR